MRDVPQIISDFGGPTAFARAIGVNVSTASEMNRRRSIPVRYWPKVISSAPDGKEITCDELMAAHASEHAA